MNLNIYKYNNYYNRVYKAEETLEGYGDPIYVLANVKSFKPNDGVDTSHTFGSAANNYNGEGDYLICTDDYGEIVSRWFIMEANFNREGQWVLTLHRDLVVDFYNSIIDAPCRVDKAILPDWNPLIYNQEDITVNQIKTSETALNDETGVAWIVGYYNNKPQHIVDTEGNPTGEVEPYLLELTADDKVNTFTENDYDIATTESFDEWFQGGIRHSSPSNWIWELYADYWNLSGNIYKYSINYNTAVRETIQHGDYGIILEKNNTTAAEMQKPFIPYWGRLAQETFNYLKNDYNPPLMDSAQTVEFLAFNNKIVRFGDGTVKKIYIQPSKTEQHTADITATSNVGTMITDILRNASLIKGTVNDNAYKVTYTRQHYDVTAEDVTSAALTIKVPNSVAQPVDASYNIFLLPYSKEGTFTLGGKVMTGEMSMKIATSLANKYASGGVLYDLQLLPYCPYTLVEDGEGGFDLPYQAPSSAPIYTEIKGADEETVLGYMLHAKTSNFTKNIPLTLKANNVKVEAQTDMYRLCSPNYNGQFEFNLAMNGGSIAYINADCTYLPYNPYIHLNPNFSGLYRQDFDDARGLICGGDFSLPIMNDKWQAYQLQNKNYQNIFDRGIENMKVQHNVGRAQDIIGAIVGTAQGTVAGMGLGSMWTGGAKNGIGGGIVGGIASLIGGIGDAIINERLRQETLDYTRDLHNFQLGNIQALPQSIAKTTAYTYNNKIFPILEYYTCTDAEKEAFANKIAWNGMTVGVIGKISDYLGNDWSYTINNKTIESKGYIKGALIRLDEVTDEYHLANAIANEINKGVYF